MDKVNATLATDVSLLGLTRGHHDLGFYQQIGATDYIINMVQNVSNKYCSYTFLMFSLEECRWTGLVKYVY